jgi:hypothetical protein
MPDGSWARVEEISRQLAALATELGGLAPTVPPVPVDPDTLPLCWGRKVSPLFRERVRLTGKDFGFDPNWLMAVMGFESAFTFSPSVRNPRSSATGLLQFMDATATELGTTTAALAAMTAEDQFDYVWLYIRNRIRERGPITRLADCYMAVLNPVAMGQPDSFVMWVSGQSAYAANAGLDADQNHQITKAEAAARVAQSLADGLRPENAI